MPPKAKPTKDTSTATIGFEANGSASFPVPPMTALRGSAFRKTEGTSQVVREAKDNNANFAWVQHFIHHLAPQGMAGFVLANGSMCSGPREIHRALYPRNFFSRC